MLVAAKARGGKILAPIGAAIHSRNFVFDSCGKRRALPAEAPLAIAAKEILGSGKVVPDALPALGLACHSGRMSNPS